MCHSVTAVSHIFYTCVVHLETIFVVVATKVYSALFTHHCCLADFIWVVSVLHSGMCVPVLFVPRSTNDTGVILANSSNWPVVSAIWAGWGVVDSTAGSPSCLMSFSVVITNELMGKVKFE